MAGYFAFLSFFSFCVSSPFCSSFPAHSVAYLDVSKSFPFREAKKTRLYQTFLMPDGFSKLAMPIAFTAKQYFSKHGIEETKAGHFFLQSAFTQVTFGHAK